MSEPNNTTLANNHNMGSELSLPQAASAPTSSDYLSLVSAFPHSTTQEEHTDDFLSSFFSASVPPTPLSFTPTGSTTSTPLETPNWGTIPLLPTAEEMAWNAPASEDISLNKNGQQMNSDVQRRRQWPNRGKDIGVRRRGSKEKPMYTRRQVEDMLDIVSKTFESRMVLFFS